MLHMLKITSTPNNLQRFLTLWSGSSCCAAQMNKPSEASRLCAVGTVERKCYHNNISDSTQQNTASLSYITVDKTKHHLSLQRRSLSLAEGSRRLSLFTPQIQRGVFFFFLEVGRLTAIFHHDSCSYDQPSLSFSCRVFLMTSHPSATVTFMEFQQEEKCFFS